MPLLQKGLNFSNSKELDFEHRVKNKKADIAIIIDRQVKSFIEVKDKNENLDKHIKQAVEYGMIKQVDFVCLTNGKEFRIYAVFATGVVDPADRLIGLFKIKDPSSPPAKLKNLFNRSRFPELNELKEANKKIKPKVTEEGLTDILKDCTEDLYKFLLNQFKRRYKEDSYFKKEIDDWAISIKIDIKDKDLVQKLCKEGSYSLINRVLFYRIHEDRERETPSITKSTISEWKTMVEKPSAKLGKLFKCKAKEFTNFYNSPLFNSITYDEIEWDEDVIIRILARFANIDFKEIENDIIGKAYEKHISEDERKRLGQFYTPQFIIDYLVSKLDICHKSRVLDPSCGSGAFLTSILRKIRKKNKTSKLAIENSIYGIDINPFAIQLTTMNLLLETIGERSKPTKINVLAADTLIDKELKATIFKSSFFKESKRNVKELNKFLSIANVVECNKKTSKFDFIVGNPPYRCFGLRSNNAMSKMYKDYLRLRWINSAEYKISYYPLFIESSINLLSQGGTLAFIIPDSFLVGMYFSKIREYILKTCKIKEIVYCQEDFWDAQVGCPTMIILQKEDNPIKRHNNKIVVKLAKSSSHIKSKNFIENKYSQDTFSHLTRNRFELYFSSGSQKIVQQIRSYTSLKFKDVVKGHTGIRASKGIGKDNLMSSKKTSSYYLKGLHSGSELSQFKIHYKKGWINLNPKNLCSGGWDPNIVERPKIMVQQTGDSLICKSLDEI